MSSQEGRPNLAALADVHESSLRASHKNANGVGLADLVLSELRSSCSWFPAGGAGR